MRPLPKTPDDPTVSVATPDRLGLFRGGEGIITGTVVCAATIGLLAGYSYLAGRRGGLGTGGSLLSARPLVLA